MSWRPYVAHIKWRPYLGAGRSQLRVGVVRPRPDRPSPEYYWIGLTWQLPRRRNR